MMDASVLQSQRWTDEMFESRKKIIFSNSLHSLKTLETSIDIQ